MLSDNGTNFVGAYNEIKKIFEERDQNKIQSSTAKHHVKWTFNPPLAQHHGGVFETMIKSAKRAVFNILSRADITDEELHTAFTGAENLINSRPLTYASSDIKDEIPLTPNHFLIGSTSGKFISETIDSTDYHPKKRWRKVQELMKHFWKRWMREWLPGLAGRNKWHRTYRDLKVDDIVLVITPDGQRGKWPIGRITKIFPGIDGHTRVVAVKIGDKEIKRPISKLCPLECETDERIVN